MNVALCISGHLRTVKKCYASQYKNLLSKFNPDVFVHTWDHSEANTSSWHDQHGQRKKIDESLLYFMEQRYEPKVFEIEKEKNFSLEGDQVGTTVPLKGLKSMTYGMAKSYTLMQNYSIKNNKVYDYVMRIRPDIKLIKNFIALKSDELSMYGNKVSPEKQVLHKGMDVNYAALDCLFVENKNKSKHSAFLVDNSFENFYCKNSFFHSPFVDYLIESKINFFIDSSIKYGSDWVIVRDPK